MMSPELTKTKSSPAASNLVGELLLKAGVVDAVGLARALEINERDQTSLGRALAQLGLAEEEAVSAAIAHHSHFEYLNPKTIEIADQAALLMPEAFCRERMVAPLGMQGKLLRVAITDPLAYQTIQDIEFLTSMRTVLVVASQTLLLHLLDRLYPRAAAGPVSSYLELLADAAPSGQLEDALEEDEITEAKLQQQTKQTPIIRLVNQILSNAAREGASDIHFERYENYVQVRYRVDGLLHDVLQVSKALQDAVISRLKISSGLDITDRRKPQDGRGQMRIDGKKISLRVSTLPTQFGEKVVVRLLDDSKAGIPMEALDFTPENLRTFTSILSRPQGMVLVTGPTGSGKTTTLYTALNSLKSPTKNIITVEDPIEYQLVGINQVQTNAKAGLTFAAGLRSILRQDPNIILVGEIRDQETAEISFSAAQTGHLLLSTLHTNDATATITRLVDIGIEPFLIAASVLGVAAQRLVRRTCPSCSVLQAPSPEVIEKIAGFKNLPTGGQWRAGRGCKECNQSGYKGRVGIHEVLEINEELRQLISNRAPELAIRNAARKAGMRTMMEDGIAKALQGLTTLEEIVRVVAQDESPALAEEAQPEERPAVTAAQSATAVAERTAVSGPARKERILIVEDSPTVASVVKYFMELEGFEMLLAEDGRTGLEIARRERPDVIVSDLYMPDMDGITMVKALRADPLTCKVAILMLTSEASIEKEAQALSAGADDYLIKPVEPRRLAARVKSILGRLAEKRPTVQP